MIAKPGLTRASPAWTHRVDSRRPFDVVSQNPLVLQRWFEDKVDFTPPLPPVPADLHLAGGRLCFFLDRRIAAYMYVADGRAVSLYVMREAGLGTPSDGLALWQSQSNVKQVVSLRRDAHPVQTMNHDTNEQMGCRPTLTL